MERGGYRRKMMEYVGCIELFQCYFGDYEVQKVKLLISYFDDWSTKQVGIESQNMGVYLENYPRATCVRPNRHISGAWSG